MAGTSPLRARLADLLTGAAGTTKVMPAGRFVAAPTGRHVDDTNVDAADRRFDIVIGPGRPITPLNGYDPTVLKEHVVTIRVGYLKTNAGDDNPESATPEGGSGVVEDIQDRAAADEADIVEVLCWHENYADLSPDCFDVFRDPGEEATVTESPDGQRVILTVPLHARIEWDYQTPATYVP